MSSLYRRAVSEGLIVGIVRSVGSSPIVNSQKVKDSKQKWSIPMVPPHKCGQPLWGRGEGNSIWINPFEVHMIWILVSLRRAGRINLRWTSANPHVLPLWMQRTWVSVVRCTVIVVAPDGNSNTPPIILCQNEYAWSGSWSRFGGPDALTCGGLQPTLTHYLCECKGRGSLLFGALWLSWLLTETPTPNAYSSVMVLNKILLYSQKVKDSEPKWSIPMVPPHKCGQPLWGRGEDNSIWINPFEAQTASAIRPYYYVMSLITLVLVQRLKGTSPKHASSFLCAM
jgi:hypothetical protein